MQIGELARRAEVAIDTVRYYERQGLLPAPPRTAGGYRAYDDGDLDRLRFIRRAKSLGFTLQQASELLQLGTEQTADVGRIRDIARAELAVVEARLRELSDIRDGLRALVDSCPGAGALSECPIHAALSGRADSTAPGRSDCAHAGDVLHVATTPVRAKPARQSA